MESQPIYQRNGRKRWWSMAGLASLTLGFVCGCEPEIEQALLEGVAGMATSMVGTALQASVSFYSGAVDAIGGMMAVIIESAIAEVILQEVGGGSVPTVRAITEAAAQMLA